RRLGERARQGTTALLREDPLRPRRLLRRPAQDRPTPDLRRRLAQRPPGVADACDGGRGRDLRRSCVLQRAAAGAECMTRTRVIGYLVLVAATACASGVKEGASASAGASATGITGAI